MTDDDAAQNPVVHVHVRHDRFAENPREPIANVLMQLGARLVCNGNLYMHAAMRLFDQRLVFASDVAEQRLATLVDGHQQEIQKQRMDAVTERTAQDVFLGPAIQLG